jgi:hypothetical protein
MNPLVHELMNVAAVGSRGPQHSSQALIFSGHHHLHPGPHSSSDSWESCPKGRLTVTLATAKCSYIVIITWPETEIPFILPILFNCKQCRCYVQKAGIQFILIEAKLCLCSAMKTYGEVKVQFHAWMTSFATRPLCSEKTASDTN